MYSKIRLALLCLCLTLLSNCQNEKPQSVQTIKLFLSAAYKNRADNNCQKHDKDCIGFFTKQIPDPAILNGLNPEIQPLNKLERITGISWQNLEDVDSICNINHYYEGTKNSVVYVFEMVNSPESQNLILSLGSDDGLMVWVNGDSIYTKHQPRGIVPNNDFVKVSLKKGINFILYKVDQGDGGWGLYRKWISKEKLDEYFSKNQSILYSDLPEATIIADTSRNLLLKMDERWKYDNYNSLQLELKNKDNTVLESINISPANIPQQLKMPGSDDILIYTLSAYNPENELKYIERIPLFRERAIKAFIDDFKTRKMNSNPKAAVINQSIKELFHLSKQEKEWTYSTRMKTHALYNFLEEYHNYPRLAGPHIDGYLSEYDKTDQIFRIFIPEIMESLPGLVFIFHGIYLDENPFWRSFEAASHTLMAKRAAYSTENNLVLMMPYGRGKKNFCNEAQEEPRLIFSKVKDFFKSEHINLSTIVWSKGTVPVIDILKKDLSVNNIALISPIFSTSIHEELLEDLLSIQKRNPKTRWFIRHGLDDKIAPIQYTREIVAKLRRLGIEVNYKEIPHSNHFNYITDPEREFYHYISNAD